MIKITFVQNSTRQLSGGTSVFYRYTIIISRMPLSTNAMSKENYNQLLVIFLPHIPPPQINNQSIELLGVSSLVGSTERPMRRVIPLMDAQRYYQPA